MDRAPAHDRLLTVPNLLSGLRLVLIPVFIYLLLAAHSDGWAVAVLMFSGASDWADGKIARLLNQSSKLGEYLDPAVDRLYMVTVPIALGLRGIVPCGSSLSCWPATCCWPRSCRCCAPGGSPHCP